MHRELDISPDVRVRIASLRDYSEANPLSLETMKHLASLYAEGKPLPLFPRNMLSIPTGWQVTYLVETHPMGKMRRLRVTHGDADKTPPLEALKLLASEFGFTNPVEKCILFPEEDEVHALNAMEPVNESMEAFGLRLDRLATAQEENVNVGQVQ